MNRAAGSIPACGGVATPAMKMIRRRDECLCGSRKPFNACCGDLSAERSVPHGIMVADQAAPEQQLRALLDGIESQPCVAHDSNPAHAHASEAAAGWVQRAVRRIELDAARQELANEVMRDILREVVEPQCGNAIGHYEAPALLLYPAGGGYGAHADSELFNPDTGFWERNTSRDHSVVLFLNHNPSGGYHFPNFKYTVEPVRGRVLAFPPDQRYVNTVDTVQQGACFVLVSWVRWQLAGQPRLAVAPPQYR